MRAIEHEPEKRPADSVAGGVPIGRGVGPAAVAADPLDLAIGRAVSSSGPATEAGRATSRIQRAGSGSSVQADDATDPGEAGTSSPKVEPWFDSAVFRSLVGSGRNGRSRSVRLPYPAFQLEHRRNDAELKVNAHPDRLEGEEIGPDTRELSEARSRLEEARERQAEADLSEQAVAEAMAFGRAALAAVRHAVATWVTQASFSDIVINGPLAIGPPGCLNGPELEELIVSAPGFAEWSLGDELARQLSRAVAAGVSSSFARWQAAVSVPALPWYPSFAAVGGPAAAPTPSVTVPLISCASSETPRLTLGGSLAAEIIAELDSSVDDAATREFCKALAEVLGIGFTIWFSEAAVGSVPGHGSCPGFAPPFGPATSPVIAGSVLPVTGVIQGTPVFVSELLISWKFETLNAIAAIAQSPTESFVPGTEDS